ncbi:hypothetical protein [Sphingobacterium multivorum]|uniref:Uncharacterized protein n=1 Tax=Sphingobacterium multivorum TaxID=28454 RepID=A0A653YSB7_SPHMU|nr:hypothetical protein [Sphingobacterium multivorum]VXC45349.1 conserved hypothetical protein [Sphingobacterium multivorum]
MTKTHTGQSFPSENDYALLICKAKRIDPKNYLDMVHDSIVNSHRLDDALSLLNGLKYSYKSVIPNDNRKLIITDQVCKKCNEVYPINFFEDLITNGSVYKRNECRNCRKKYRNELYAKNKNTYRENVIKRSKGHFCKTCNKTFSEADLLKFKNPEKKIKRNCIQCRLIKKNKGAYLYRRRHPEKLKVSRSKYSKSNKKYIEAYHFKNREIIKEKKRLWRQKNRKKINDYKRLYASNNREKVREYVRKSRRKNKELSNN